MKVEGWEQRYRGEAEIEDESVPRPNPLVEQFLGDVPAATALDLAAGTGRNAIWLAQRGWNVTAVEGALTAVDILERRSNKLAVPLRTVVADLQKGEFTIPPDAWNAIIICYYLQRDLIEAAKAGVRPGGILIVIVHTTEGESYRGVFLSCMFGKLLRTERTIGIS